MRKKQNKTPKQLGTHKTQFAPPFPHLDVHMFSYLHLWGNLLNCSVLPSPAASLFRLHWKKTGFIYIHKNCLSSAAQLYPFLHEEKKVLEVEALSSQEGGAKSQLHHTQIPRLFHSSVLLSLSCKLKCLFHLTQRQAFTDTAMSVLSRSLVL